MTYTGRTDESDIRRLASSAVLAVLLWAVVGIVLAFVPAFRRTNVPKEYRDLVITLASLPADVPVFEAEPQKVVPEEPQKVVPDAPAPVPVPVPPRAQTEDPGKVSVSNTPAAKPEPAAKPQPAAKPEPAAKPQTAAKPEPATKSAGLGIPNFSAPVQSSPAAVSDAEFLDFSSQAVSRQQEAKRSNDGGIPAAELQGAAGVVVRDQNVPASSVRPARVQPGAADTGTTAALDRIAASAKAGDSAEVTAGGDFAASAGESRSTGESRSRAAAAGAVSLSAISGLSFEGVPRKLMSPAVPSITLPDSLASLVDSDRSVTVQFTVLADGTVPIGLVFFSPSAVLPPEIRDYLKREFSLWRFEKHTEDGQARFVYSIKMQ